MRWLALLLALVVSIPAQATRQVLVHRDRPSNAGTPVYHAIGGAEDGNGVSTHATTCPIPIATTAVELDFGVAVAPGAGKSATSTLVKNGSATAMTATISDASTGPEVSRTAVSFVPGDTARLEITTSGGPSVRSMQRLAFDGVQNGWSFLCSMSQDDTVSSSPEYMSLAGTGTVATSPICATQTSCRTPIPVPLTARYLYCVTDVAPGFSGSSFDLTLMDGTGATAITCNITGTTDTDCNETANSHSFTQGDWMTIKIDLTDGGSGINLPKVACGIGIRPDNPDLFLIPYSSANFSNLSATANRYSRLNAVSGYESALGLGPANAEQSFGHALVVKAMTVELLAAPGTTPQNYAITLQDDAASTAATVTIVDADTIEHWSGSVEVAEYSLGRTLWDPGSTPTATRGAVTYAAIARPRRPQIMQLQWEPQE